MKDTQAKAFFYRRLPTAQDEFFKILQYFTKKRKVPEFANNDCNLTELLKIF
jgi:hypothetical protein